MEYTTQSAADYAQHRRLQPAVLAALRQAVPATPDAQVLEVGCGTGNYIGALTAAAGCRGWGAEPAAAMRAVAAARYPQVTFLAAGAETLDLPAAQIDLLFTVDVIHHVADRTIFFEAAYRTLKPGGRLCTATDSPDLIRRRQPLSVYFPETVAADLARYPTPERLQAELVQSGFALAAPQLVEFAYPVEDAAPFRAKAFSCLRLIPAEAFDRGLAQMERDLAAGPVAGVSRYLLLWAAKPRRP